MADYFPIYSYLGKKYDLNYMSGGSSDNNIYLLYATLFIIIILVIFIFQRINNKYDSLTNILYNLKTQQNKNEKIKEIREIKQIKQVKQGENDENTQTTKKISLNINNQNQNQNQEQIPVPPNPINIWREYDYRALNDPLVAPRRRDDYNLPVLPLPTRGFPSPYKKVGILINREANDNDRYKILLLMGRNTYPSSTAYEYYAVENDKNSSLKFDINKTREMQSGDKVKIEELDKIYTVVMDKILGYEYDPYIY
jgi:hypothetical protein